MRTPEQILKEFDALRVLCYARIATATGPADKRAMEEHAAEIHSRYLVAELANVQHEENLEHARWQREKLEAAQSQLEAVEEKQAQDDALKQAMLELLSHEEATMCPDCLGHRRKVQELLKAQGWTLRTGA